MLQLRMPRKIVKFRTIHYADICYRVTAVRGVIGGPTLGSCGPFLTLAVQGNFFGMLDAVAPDVGATSSSRI